MRQVRVRPGTARCNHVLQPPSRAGSTPLVGRESIAVFGSGRQFLIQPLHILDLSLIQGNQGIDSSKECGRFIVEPAQSMDPLRRPALQPGLNQMSRVGMGRHQMPHRVLFPKREPDFESVLWFIFREFIFPASPKSSLRLWPRRECRAKPTAIWPGKGD